MFIRIKFSIYLDLLFRGFYRGTCVITQGQCYPYIVIAYCSFIYSISMDSSGGSRSKNFDPGWVSHLWFGFAFGKFPLKMSNFSIFSLRVKKNILGSGPKVPRSKADQPLIYCRSKVSSGRVRVHL